MADLRDQIAVAIHAVQHPDNPIVAIPEAADPRHRVGACYRCIDSADAVLAVVEAHTRAAQAQALRDAADALVWKRPETCPCANPDACCGGIEACDAMLPSTLYADTAWLRARADELHPRPEEDHG